MESVVQLCKLPLECLIARTQDAASSTMAPKTEEQKKWERWRTKRRRGKSGKTVKIKATLNDFGSLALVWIMSDGGVRSDTDANNASHEEGKGQRWRWRERADLAVDS